jgi:mRNA interferase MazF
LKAGDVVVMRFPFSDLSGMKPRPAVVLAVLDRGDLIACQITSQANVRTERVQLDAASFVRGSLPVTSYALPGKLFTAHHSIVGGTVGRLVDVVRENIRDSAVRLIRRN